MEDRRWRMADSASVSSTSGRPPPGDLGVTLAVSPIHPLPSLCLLTRRSVKMDVPPAAVLALPDAGLFGAARPGMPVAVHKLREPVIGDHGHVPDQADVRVAHRV